MRTLLEIRNLSVGIERGKDVIPAVRNVNLDIRSGEIVCLVGGSGSGKTVTSLAVLRLIDYEGGRITGGEIIFQEQDIASLAQKEISGIRGRKIAMVTQDPMTALNPVFTIGNQFVEVIRKHKSVSRSEAWDEAIKLLEKVHIPEPASRMKQYPLELSGGMLQRVAIALALACQPELLIADEPTTALDVTIQAQILNLLLELRAEEGMSILFITHDLAVAAEIADKVAVMHEGSIVEQGTVREIFAFPGHWYTKTLVQSKRDLLTSSASEENRQDDEVILEAEGISKAFPLKGKPFQPKRYVQAVDEVSLYIRKGETLGLVGESGSGKSTLGKLLVSLQEADSGQILYRGKDVTGGTKREKKELRKNTQVVFQDTFSALNPRWKVEDIIGEPLRVHTRLSKDEIRERVEEVLQLVDLDPASRTRYPHEFSGGQRQRINIARAIILHPEFLLLDEAVSALDLAVQAKVIDLLKKLQLEMGLSYVFIAHGLDVVRDISHRIGVMYLGRIVEIAPAEELFTRPAHPYTKALLEANPTIDLDRKRERHVLHGEIPSPVNPPAGCHFHTRCPLATEKCRLEAPAMESLIGERAVACHYPLEKKERVELLR
ncbi:ABC transporter ATP-binding protein [Terribacillus saccharophilus]|uniref:ABC transporter ATP-binding protein n=1 Tax=Terribacillus saccharophilus TaxID=361277 RepID=UPI002989B687|nr:ABC transporter ATP-binding protein [Terribacillus saccharophilus]MCM3227339.1 ABC transporter ATP-binding protein [Terribacillus saccharophilus]